MSDKPEATPNGEPPIFPAPSDAKISELKAANRGVHTFKIAGHVVVCKKMSRPTWKRVQAIVDDEDNKEDTADVILGDTLLYPTRELFEAFLDEFPAAAGPIAKDLIAMAKGEAAKRGKPA